MPLSSGTIIGRDYRVVRPLAEGGMGAVYEVQQLSTGRRRALKTMHASLAGDAASVERFTQEARIGSAIPSDHVVEVIAAGIDEATGVAWLTMELLEGETLGQRIARGGAMAPGEVLAVLEQVCHALEAAHARGIVHRDLKPENVFLARARRSDVPFTVKILDFGIAKWMQELRSTSANSQALGTPLWMAPEQATPGTPIRPCTDVWALGLIAFCLLSGRNYWKSASTPDGSVQSLVVEIMVEPIEPPSHRCSRLGAQTLLPQGFDAWFVRCVVRDPAARFADAAVAMSALRPLLSTFPSQATLLAGTTPYVQPAAAPPGLSTSNGVAASFPLAPIQSTPRPTRGIPAIVILPLLAVVLLLLAGLIAGALFAIGLWTGGRSARSTGNASDVPRIASASGDLRALEVSAGALHACARMTDRTLRCWGSNMLGQAGDGTTANRLTPVRVADIDTADDVSAGVSYTCAVLAGGMVRCWGENQGGKLGDGSQEARFAPTAVLDLTGATAVRAGFMHTCALVSDRSMRCWGSNGFGGLGDSSRQRLTPAPVPGVRNVKQMSVGVGGSCAVHLDGTVSCWGMMKPPAVVAGLSGAKQVATGAQSQCALLEDGSIRCWGDNKQGQLGDGTTTARPSPARVVGIDRAVQMSMGSSHACAVTRDGTVRCWGSNASGQLGDGTMREQPAPVEVRGLSAVEEVSVGGDYTCARKKDGVVLCWGGNNNGQLGDGTYDRRSEPRPVKF